MTDTSEEYKKLRQELFEIRLQLEYAKRDREAYTELRAQLLEVRKKIAKYKYNLLMKEKQKKERGRKNGKF